jgi:hypothetical protein
MVANLVNDAELPAVPPADNRNVADLFGIIIINQAVFLFLPCYHPLKIVHNVSFYSGRRSALRAGAGCCTLALNCSELCGLHTNSNKDQNQLARDFLPSSVSDIMIKMEREYYGYYLIRDEESLAFLRPKGQDCWSGQVFLSNLVKMIQRHDKFVGSDIVQEWNDFLEAFPFFEDDTLSKNMWPFAYSLASAWNAKQGTDEELINEKCC